MELTTEQLKSRYAEMEKLEVSKFSCGRYRIVFGGNMYWIDSEGGLELIGETPKPLPRRYIPEWMKVNSKASDTQVQ